MKRTILLLLTTLLIGLKVNSQNLTCSDFKTGRFYIPKTKEIGKYTVVSNDSIWEFTADIDTSVKKHVVVREKNTQIEWENEIGNGSPRHEIIEWIDDCTYRLTYDASKSELEDDKQWINKNNGIIVSKNKIEGNCMHYTATMILNDGSKISQNGIICKE
ncbi:hypothetical protein [Sinomicrobium weinanense]|uniref:Uncharacterized protein n=1 Tax=Sinomicrobium weinanense TaxID=2842200 RepID=A0A926Q3D2_9FLAO|nr:hypothetical protein [Sinomicrobium weinanense]MBC9796794.1 hypothetical protein [Sinomicrobium weinanense]MBU3125519.1 hypothetical protein [Sinomicrobium weinanense]